MRVDEWTKTIQDQDVVELMKGSAYYNSEWEPNSLLALFSGLFDSRIEYKRVHLRYLRLQRRVDLL